MNAGAVEIWKAMGKPSYTIDDLHRPPKSSSLIFGVPFMNEESTFTSKRESAVPTRRA